MSFSIRADVETDLLGDRERARLVDLAAAAKQLLVELEIFLAAGLVLHAHGDGDLRRLHRALASTGNSFSTNLSFASFLIRSSMSLMARLQ